MDWLSVLLLALTGVWLTVSVVLLVRNRGKSCGGCCADCPKCGGCRKSSAERKE